MKVTFRQFRAAALGAAAVATLAAGPAHAQFGGFSLGSLGKSKPAETTSNGCPEGKKKSVGASILGSVAGSVANRAAGRFAAFVPIPEVAETLTNAIACRLDAKEQKQAAEATLAATKGDSESGTVKVGDSAEWVSASRSDVKGKSTVIAIESPPADSAGLADASKSGGKGGGKGLGQGQGQGKGKQLASAAQCITVSDVVIVNGEETTANKRMCRAPGSQRYSLMA